jgi:hypothetical protein
MLAPNNGSAVTNKGSMAQWIAQATEVVTPTASQLTLTFIKRANLRKSNVVAKHYQVVLCKSYNYLVIGNFGD